MKVTAQEEYGLRCLVQVARGHAQGRSLSITEIAQGEGLSTPYVGKILAVLRKGGLVTAARGRSGGYTLTRNPRAITLDEVLSILGGRLFTSDYCDKFQGALESCVHTDDCNIRSVWGSIELVLACVFKRMTLGDLTGSEQQLRDSLTEALRDSIADRPTRAAVTS